MDCRSLSKIAFVAIAGCAAPVGEPADLSEETEDAITHGKRDTTHTSVAMITFDIPLEGAKTKPSTCTGTLVAKNTLLTAAHCVRDRDRQYKNWKASFDPSLKNGAPTNPIRVTKTIVHPGFSGGAGPADLALMILERTPPGLKPVPIVDTIGNLEGKNLTIVGYGATETKNDEFLGVGVRRVVTVKVSERTGQYLLYRGLKGTCGGDSGGPGLISVGGVETIAAITVLGMGECGQASNIGSGLRIDKNAKAVFPGEEVRTFLEQHLDL